MSDSLKSAFARWLNPQFEQLTSNLKNRFYMRHFTLAFSNLKQTRDPFGKTIASGLAVTLLLLGSANLNTSIAQDCDPQLTIVCPDDTTVECGFFDPEMAGWPTVTTADCYNGELEISFDDVILSFGSCEATVSRTWTATAEQEVQFCTQIITVLDTEAPTLIMPDNLYYELEWGVFEINVIDAFLAGEISVEEILALTPAYMDALEVQGFFWPLAEDVCDGEVQPFYAQTIYGSDETDCPVVAQAIWEFFATDGCGNTSEGIVIVCDFLDTTPPEFLCEPEPLTVECIEDVPAPMECEAFDTCDDNVLVEIFTSETGNLTDSCVAATAYGPGDDWAIWLPMLEADGVTPTDDFIADGDLTFIQYDDGTAHFYGHVVNSEDGTCGWDLDLWFQNEADWAAWSAMGRSYKDDIGLGACCYEDWTYYELVDNFSTLTGTGCLDGSVLYLDHMPASYYFGFQCGQGANNKNGNFGMSGWFTYTGSIDGESVTGQGDLNVDKECVPVNLQECPNDDEFTYFWRAEDSCGNATVITQVITVDDQTPPTFTVVPEDITVECDELPVPLFEGLEAVDNCEGEVIIEYIGESDPEGDDCLYTFTRIWAAFDLCGNRADWIQTITVEDTTPPVLDYAGGEMTLECDEEVTLPEVGATDNCQTPTVTMTMATEPGDCPQNWFEIYTWVATDGCGNESTPATLVVEYDDTTAPVFDPYEISTQVECNDIESLEPLTATDNCGAVTVTMEESLQSGGCLGVLVRVWTATDECGNSTEVEQFITILDTTPPVINNPADATVECDEVPETPGEDGIEIYDNCDGEVTVEFTETITDGVCEDSYTITWTWVATDYCENMSTATTVITVQDTTDPIFTQLPDDMTYECDQEVPACDINNVVAEDNCDDDVTVTCEDEVTPGDCPQEYSIMRIYRAFDNCGNQAIYVQNIYVVDTTAPVVTQPETINLECTDTVELPEIEAIDNCGATTLAMTMDSAPGECQGDWFEYYTYTATDECGNVSEPVTLTVVYTDNTGPVFDAYEIEIDMPCDDIGEGGLIATDACCDDVTITYEDTPVSGGCAGRIIRDYVATDCCGNTSTAQQIITLIDEVPPVWTLFPADVTVECDNVPSNDGIEVDWTDNCTEVTLTYDGEVIIPGTCEDSYTIERTWTITDNCDNATSATWTITVQDTTAPEFTAVGESVTIECDQELPAPFATAEDNCDDDVEITVSPEIIPGECEAEYTMVRTYTATDNCGNTATATQTITVVDTTAPVLDYAGGEMTLECDEEVTLPEVGATDNCSTVEVNMTMVTEPGDCPQNWFEIYTWTATDACGNDSESATLVVEYDDTTPPVFDPFQVFVEIPCDEIIEMTLTATDNCSSETNISVTYVEVMQSGGCAGLLIRDYTATDECGNSTTVQQIIDLIDNEAPIWTSFPEDITAECDDIPGIEGVEVSYVDNCTDDIDLAYNGQVIIPGDCVNSYSIEHSWTITDHCENENTAVWTITVQDTTAPEFIGGVGDVNVQCLEDAPPYPPITATDNCGTATVSFSEEVLEEEECGNSVTLITITATDECENSTSISYTITVSDTTAPELDYEGGQLSLECDEVLELPEVGATDNCSIAEVNMTMTSEEGECPNNWYEVYTWTATDACGNVSESVSLYVDYSDNTPPEFIGGVGNVTVQCPDDAPSYPPITATDNCGTATVTFAEEVLDADDCGNSITEITITATDECENSVSISYTVTVLDTTAPEFDQELEASIVLDCLDDVPAAEDCTATDNCDETVEVTFTEVLTGELPAEGSDADCVLSTPAEYDGEGTTCDNNEPWSVRLFTFPGDEFYSNIDGQFVQYPDGSATLNATVVSNNNPEAGWIVDVTFQDGMDWDMWSTQGFPTGHKDDCGLGADDFEDWTYYIMSAGNATMTGWGDYAGSTLTLTHAPSNYYYGYQVGTAANNVNDQYGNGGWFTYSGIFNQQNITGSGDFAFDMDCCPQYSIERTWCAIDCTGNETCFTQTITFEDLGDPIPGVTPAPLEVEADKGDFVIIRVNPNPAVSYAQVEFQANVNNSVKMEVYDLSGRMVATLFNGTVKKGERYIANFNTNNLESGMYTIQLYSETTKRYEKLSVTK
jgi:hypothetical protein